MGIVDIKAALKKAAGENFSFQNVMLGYKEKGKKEYIRCFLTHKPTGTSRTEEYTFVGGRNPTEAAAEFGRELAVRFNEE